MTTIASRNWDIRESGPADAAHTALLLPGGLCTAMFYDEVMSEASLSSVRLVAVTLPGHGGTPPPPSVSIENYAHLMSCLATDLGCSAVVGHSTGATVALEMAASGGFDGPLVLLAPSFSRPDEAIFLRILDRVATVLGRLPYVAMRAMFGAAVSGSPLPRPRRQALVAELRKNDPAVMRQGIHRYLQYLDAHRSVAPRLVSANVAAWVVHGESGDGGITQQERETLQAAPQITLVTVPGPSVFTQCEEPALVAQLADPGGITFGVEVDSALALDRLH